MPKRSLALEFLIAAYGPDKLADPTQAEPVVRASSSWRPTSRPTTSSSPRCTKTPANISWPKKPTSRAATPSRATRTCTSPLGGYYNRQGDYNKLVENLSKNIELEPPKTPRRTTAGDLHWDKASRDFRLSNKEKLDIVWMASPR